MHKLLPTLMPAAEVEQLEGSIGGWSMGASGWEEVTELCCANRDATARKRPGPTVRGATGCGSAPFPRVKLAGAAKLAGDAYP